MVAAAMRRGLKAERLTPDGRLTGAIVWLSRNHAMQMWQSYGDLYRNKIAAGCGLSVRASPPEHNVPILSRRVAEPGRQAPRFKPGTFNAPSSQRASARSKWEGIYESWRRDDAGHRGAESGRQSQNCGAAHGRS